MKKKLLSFILVICLALSFVGCGNKTNTPPPAPEQLAAPTNLTATLSGNNGIVTWAPVENATSYVVTLNGEEKTTSNTYYQIIGVVVDYTISVVAHADGYIDSVAASTTLAKPEILVSITGKPEVLTGKSIELKADVEGTSNKSVKWSLAAGDEAYASIDEVGKLSAKAVTGDKLVTVKATSVEDPNAYAIKRITIVSMTELTQDMLDALDAETKIGFEGYLIVNLFTMTGRPYTSISYDIKTAMDGTHWYAQYEMATGVASGLYYANHDGKAAQVSVSFMNEESFATMLDDDGLEVAWEDSGLQNNFKGLDAEEFGFNNKWRHEYSGGDKDFLQHVVASACPYDFVAKNLSFLVADGEIAGIYMESEDDYTVAEQYIARMELTAALNTGDAVTVPTIGKYKNEVGFHEELTEAIDNMRALDSFTLDFLNVGANVVTSSYDSEGFVEKVTDKVCHFEPYVYMLNSSSAVGTGDGIKVSTGLEYGFVDVTEGNGGKTMYNSYYINDDGDGYVATRAYEDEFESAKPSFNFAAELFTKRAHNDDDSYTYYVDEPMSSVASLFYHGVGNDIALYGLFAQEGRTATATFTPYVTVKDGKIVDAGFYYYLGYLYGIVEIYYSDFDTTVIADEVLDKLDVTDPDVFAIRQVPTSWNQLMITKSSADLDGGDESETNALEYLKSFYDDEDIAGKLPFFGNVLGDTYGFGLTTSKTYAGRLRRSVVFYYDVPLDEDYTIESKLALIRKQLLDNGFEHIGGDIFVNGEIYVQPLDSSLDLNIYIWRVEATTPTPETDD